MPTDPAPTPAVSERPRRVVVAGVVPREAAGPGAEAEDLLVRRARVLRDEGVEVVWAGSGLRAEQVAAIAVAEDVAGVEVAPPEMTGEVAAALAAVEARDIEVVAVDRRG